jgi:hypothetical protein
MDICVPRQQGYRRAMPLGMFSFVVLDEYVCLGCGLVETYVRDIAGNREKIRAKSAPVSRR